MHLKSQVTAVPAAHAEDALTHFQRRLSYETDCWDVQHAIRNQLADFVLLDVRSPDDWAAGHVPTAINLPTRQINTGSLPPLAEAAMYVVYCAGPHCNGANKAAVRIAKLGHPVKEMIGGVRGWMDEGFELALPR